MNLEQRVANLEKEVAELKVMVSTQPDIINEMIEGKLLKVFQEANQQHSAS